MLALRDERWVAEKRDQWNCIKHNTLITVSCCYMASCHWCVLIAVKVD
ncbi:hypothetical protein POPTR_003G203701v4 [Populus trichocarpa]|uniref:Uncharacterized protein n=1 Tax=Populus trichocarpa TaxID=3694 RepID=A0ACC0TAP0_POPTR|nr:hypothetical protein BDE02_03G187500 [Populus trichocarpa]KAI9398617.1 hypothetical protein POPTR_003G203701v4 [Populus trichocarpa]